MFQTATPFSDGMEPLFWRYKFKDGFELDLIISSIEEEGCDVGMGIVLLNDYGESAEWYKDCSDIGLEAAVEDGQKMVRRLESALHNENGADCIKYIDAVAMHHNFEFSYNSIGMLDSEF